MIPKLLLWLYSPWVARTTQVEVSRVSKAEMTLSNNSSARWRMLPFLAVMKSHETKAQQFVLRPHRGRSQCNAIPWQQATIMNVEQQESAYRSKSMGVLAVGPSNTSTQSP